MLHHHARLFARAVQSLIDAHLQRLEQRHTWLGLHLTLAARLNQALHLELGAVDNLLNALDDGVVGNRVAQANRVAVVQQPKVDQPLTRVEKAHRRLGPMLILDNVNE